MLMDTDKEEERKRRDGGKDSVASGAAAAGGGGGDDGVVVEIPEQKLELKPPFLPLYPRRVWATRTGPTMRSVAEVRTIESAVFENPLPPGCVMVAVGAAGVNGGCETFRARGEHWFEKNKKASNGFALGAEGVGVVVDKGPGCIESDTDPRALHIGSRVAFIGGAFSEACVVPERMCWPIRQCRAEEAALVISGTFACGAMRRYVREGDTVLVTAAAGGAGHFAIQFAKRCGAYVIATVGSDAKRDAVAALGCTDRIINHSYEDVGEVLRDEFPRGIDVAFEGVGGAMFDAVLENMASGGRLLVAGYISQYPHVHADGRNGQNADASSSSSSSSPATSGRRQHRQHKYGALIEDIFWKSATVEFGDDILVTGRLWPETAEEREDAREAAFTLADLGAIKPLVDTGASFVGVDACADAVDYMLEGKAIGKVVVAINPNVLDAT